MRNPSIDQLYSNYLIDAKENAYASKFWIEIPKQVSDLTKNITLSSKSKSSTAIPLNTLEELKHTFEMTHRKRMSWTESVKEKVLALPNNIIEGSHQAVLFGGSAFVINKIACTWRLSQLTNNTPVFFIADYDQVQPELTNIHFAGLGAHGYTLSIPIAEGYEFSPISSIPLPNENWLRTALEEIQNNYGLMTKSLPRLNQTLLKSNIGHISNIILSTYFSSKTIGEWTARILDNLINIELNLGIPLIVSSDFRSHYQNGFEFLLTNSNRLKFIQSLNRIYELIQKKGYTPGLKTRENTYTPFFYECPNHSCHRARIRLATTKEKKQLMIKGTCPQCKQTIEFQVSSTNPDLTDHMDYLSPRVDSRQILISRLLPIHVHVGGPGETSYFAQVLPSMNELGIPPPIFYRYIRSFYNTPWNEQTSDVLSTKGLPVLTAQPLFSTLRSWAKATRKHEYHQLKASQLTIKDHIHSVHSKLTAYISKMKESISTDTSQDDKTTKRRTTEQRILQINEIERYLANAFGEYDPQKFGQEVSFSWIDLATLTGINQLLHTYARIYSLVSPPVGYFFMNIRFE